MTYKLDYKDGYMIFRSSATISVGEFVHTPKGNYKIIQVNYILLENDANPFTAEVAYVHLTGEEIL